MVLVPQGTGRVDRCQHWFLALWLGLIFASSPAFASSLASSADSLEAGAWSGAVYYDVSRTEPEVKISGVDSIQVPVSGGGSTSLFSENNAQIEMEQDANTVMAAVTFRPFEGLHYRVKVGQVQNFKLEYSSASGSNSLEALKDGYLWGVGLRHNFTQGTIVSAAVAIDLGYTRTVVDLDRFRSLSGVAASNIRFEQEELQAAINFSRRWNWGEPYGGLKIFRTVTRLEDEASKGRISGYVDTVAPFLGLKLNFFERESFFVEGSVIGEESVSAGFSIRFP